MRWSSGFPTTHSSNSLLPPAPWVSTDPVDKGSAQHFPPFQMPITGCRFSPWRVPQSPPPALRTQEDSLFARLPGHVKYTAQKQPGGRGGRVWMQQPYTLGLLPSLPAEHLHVWSNLEVLQTPYLKGLMEAALCRLVMNSALSPPGGHVVASLVGQPHLWLSSRFLKVSSLLWTRVRLQRAGKVLLWPLTCRKLHTCGSFEPGRGMKTDMYFLLQVIPWVTQSSCLGEIETVNTWPSHHFFAWNNFLNLLMSIYRSFIAYDRILETFLSLL